MSSLKYFSRSANCVCYSKTQTILFVLCLRKEAINQLSTSLRNNRFPFWFRSKERPRNGILGFGRAMKREPKREPPPPGLLDSQVFVRFLTLASRSLLRNSTETLATQARLTEASSQPLSHAYFLNMFSYLGKHSRLIIVWSYDWMPFSVFAIRITSILKKSTVSAQGYDMSSLEDILPACRHLLFPLLHAEKGRLRNAVANRVPASRWQGILFRINCEIISG